MLAKRRLAAFGILSIAILICVPTSPLGGLPQTPIEQTHKLWGVYWSAERGFSSVLEMKNNRPDRAVTVHVSLYFLSGEEHYLTAETLGPRETKALDLNRALEALPRSVAAQRCRASQPRGYAGSRIRRGDIVGRDGQRFREQSGKASRLELFSLSGWRD